MDIFIYRKAKPPELETLEEQPASVAEPLDETPIAAPETEA
jgi:hypothetical protein